MDSINDFDLKQRDARSMFGHIIENLSTSIFGICIAFTILFGGICIIILSLIPIYLQNNAIYPILNQNSTLISVIYKTNLSNGTSFTIEDINTLNQQFRQIYNLQDIILSIISYNFTSLTIERIKRQTNSIQCEDGSTFSNVLLNFNFSIISIEKYKTIYQWQQILRTIQRKIRLIYKQFTIIIPFRTNQPSSVQLNICSLKILSGAGIGGSHSAYRLAPIHKNNLCIFERENHVGGRTYDIDYNGNIPEAYSTSPIAPMGGMRFYELQPVVKQLADELNISYYQYDYQTFLIKARGKLYTSLNEMCLKSYIELNCTDSSNGLNALSQLWNKLFNEYNKNPLNVYNFADFTSFCRYLLGDEATEYLKDAFRHRGVFQNVDAYFYIDISTQQSRLDGNVYYPNEGLSQFAKRMIDKATTLNNVRLYLNEEVIQIDENTNNEFIFSVETTKYKIYGKQLIIAIPPYDLININGLTIQEIKSNKHFQSILPIKVVVIMNYWPERWWEKTNLSNTNIDRAWTKQNCISFFEILSRHPQKREQNITRTVYDDGLCIDTWSTLIHRSSQKDLIDELLRGLRTLFVDIEIPLPTKTFTNIWSGAWHFQKSNSNVTNKQIISWALKPMTRFEKHQISLVGEAFYLAPPAWIDSAIKSSLSSLYSQFNFSNVCYENDAASNGNYCSAISI